MPTQSTNPHAEFAPGMIVRLANGETGRLRTLYRYAPALAPHTSHDRALVFLPGNDVRDVRADEIRERVTVRPALAVVGARP